MTHPALVWLFRMSSTVRICSCRTTFSDTNCVASLYLWYRYRYYLWKPGVQLLEKKVQIFLIKTAHCLWWPVHHLTLHLESDTFTQIRDYKCHHFTVDKSPRSHWSVKYVLKYLWTHLVHNHNQVNILWFHMALQKLSIDMQKLRESSSVIYIP